MHAYCMLQEQQPGLQSGESGCSLLVVQARGIQVHSIYQRVFKITQKPSACTIITTTGVSLHISSLLHSEPVINGRLTEIENTARGDEQSPHLVSVRWCQVDSHHNHRTQFLKLLWNILIQPLHPITCSVTTKLWPTGVTHSLNCCCCCSMLLLYVCDWTTTTIIIIWIIWITCVMGEQPIAENENQPEPF